MRAFEVRGVSLLLLVKLGVRALPEAISRNACWGDGPESQRLATIIDSLEYMTTNRKYTEPRAV